MEFVKLYQQILYSSVWELSCETRIVWITCLALADKTGSVQASVGGLARAARVTRQECERALADLMAPDPDDRSGVEQGRRLIKIRGGWQVVNHAYYRDLRSTKQEADAARKRKERAAQRKSGGEASESVRNVQTDQIRSDQSRADTNGSIDRLDRVGNSEGERKRCECPADLDLTVADYLQMTEAYDCTEADLEQAVLDFRRYWRVEGGKGEQRTRWLARLRDDMRIKFQRGQLAGRGAPRLAAAEAAARASYVDQVLAAASSGELGDKAKQAAAAATVPSEREALASKLERLYAARTGDSEAA